MPALNLYNLTKNLTAQPAHNLCAVLPIIIKEDLEMDNFIKIADKYYKLAAKVSGGIIGLIMLYIVGKTLHAASQFSGGFYTFMYVLYWIFFVVLVLCGGYYLFRKYGAKIATAATTPQSQPQQPNPYAQPASAPVGGEKFCTVCGAKVPAGNQFCNSCGNKMF